MADEKSRRAAELADKLEETVARFESVVEGLSSKQWQMQAVNHPTIHLGDKDEERSVGTLAHHVAVGDFNVTQMVGMIASGKGLPPLDGAQLAQSNAEQARQHPSPDKAATMTLLRKNAADSAELVRGLTDSQLKQTGQLFGRDYTTESLIEEILIGHPQWHIESIQATTGA